MKKLIIKTALITVAAVIAFCVVLYGCLAFFTPKTIADGWAFAGNYSIAVKYYEKQYEKTKSENDLAVLCVKVDEVNDATRAAKYLAVFTASGGFETYCLNEGENHGYAISAREFYFGKYAVSAYYADGIDAAITVAENSVSVGYTESNAFYIMLIEIKSLSHEDGVKIAAAINGIKSGLTDSAEIGFADRDIGYAEGK
ncbi:MAG: hypothetical protein IJU83_00620 [Clostridia bacterium]|nr:hypothetical protein [Clostridia bacterium]